MESYNNKKEEKKGLLPFLSRLFGSGSKTASSFGRAASLGKAAGSAGLFSSKAGLVGLVLGGATIAAGIGVIYNFIGPSSSKVYTPDLFQNSYYEEQAQKANSERLLSKQASIPEKSTIDMFKEQAKKEGLSSDENSQENSSSSQDSESKSSASSDINVPVPENSGAEANTGVSGGGKLQASLGFNSKGGGSSSSAPKLQTSGGLFGGIGQQFAPVYRPTPNQANAGKAGNMKGALASKITNSPKYSVPNVNRKGAYGQAKFAKISGMKAMYSATPTGAKTEAAVGFDMTTPQTGDVGTPTGGVGVGGAGVTNGPQLKGNDPSLNTTEVQPPAPADKIEDNPYKNLMDKALYGMLIATALIFAVKLLTRTAQPWALTLARVLAYAAMAAAGLVILAGLGLMTGRNIFGGGKDFPPQKLMGGMYMLAGAILMWQAYQALQGVEDGEKVAKHKADLQDKIKSLEAQGKQQEVAAYKAELDAYNKAPFEKQVEIANSNLKLDTKTGNWIPQNAVSDSSSASASGSGSGSGSGSSSTSTSGSGGQPQQTLISDTPQLQDNSTLKS